MGSPPAPNSKVPKYNPKLVKTLADFQAAWIKVRRRVTRRPNQTQSTCIGHNSYEYRFRG